MTASRAGGTATLVGFRTGDAAEVESIRKRVRGILAFRGYGIPADVREDLEQEVMKQLWETVEQSDLDSDARLFGLTRVVTVRRCIDWLRTRKPTVPVLATMPARDPDPLQQTLGRERMHLAAQALSELGQPCRELLYLVGTQGMSYREASRILRKSPGALRTRMHRCINALRKALAERERQATGANLWKGLR